MEKSLKDKLVDKIIYWLVNEELEKATILSDFERVRYELRPCDVILIEGRSRVSEVIRAVTQSHWTHSALYVGRIHDIENKALRNHLEEHYQGPKDEQLVIESILGQGTIASPISNYKNDHIRICRPAGISHDDCKKVIGYVIGRLGMEYDIRQILDLLRFLLPWSVMPRRWRSSLFNKKPGTPTRIICSTLLAEAFHSVHFPLLPLIRNSEREGLELIPRNPKLFTPSDFDYSPFFEIIKYPIVDVSDRAIYRRLPWAKEGVFSEQRGAVFMSEPENLEKESTQKINEKPTKKPEEVKKDKPKKKKSLWSKVTSKEDELQSDAQQEQTSSLEVDEDKRKDATLKKSAKNDKNTQEDIDTKSPQKNPCEDYADEDTNKIQSPQHAKDSETKSEEDLSKIKHKPGKGPHISSESFFA